MFHWVLSDFSSLLPASGDWPAFPFEVDVEGFKMKEGRTSFSFFRIFCGNF